MDIKKRLFPMVISDGYTYIVRMSRRAVQCGTLIIAVLFLLGVGGIVWGASKQAELQTLREQTELQQEQLKLLEQKSEVLERKMQALDMLDQEIRQLIQGAEQGTEAKGGPSGNFDLANVAVKPIGREAVSPVVISARLTKIDLNAQRRLASFYTLKNILAGDEGEHIKMLQEEILSAGSSGDVNATIPSVWPAKGVISSTFGYRADPVDGDGAFHAGLDIANEYATMIQATAAGRVLFAGDAGDGYGNRVEIDHGNGVVTLYAHNSAVLVSTGTAVTQGESIALMGSTGKSTGVHLHYEVRINGTAVDPMMFLPIR